MTEATNLHNRLGTLAKDIDRAREKPSLKEKLQNGHHLAVVK